MKQYINKIEVKKITSNPLISGTFFIFSGGMIANAFNFLFNLGMSRNLGVAEYGNVISLVSIILLATIPAGSVVPTIVSRAGSYFADNDDSHLKALFVKILKPISIVGFVFIILFIVFSKQIGSYLHINNPIILFFTSVSIFIGYIGSIPLAFLQARLSFRLISFANILSSVAKLSIGFLLVLLGFGEDGALTAILISLSIPTVVALIALKKILLTRIKKLPVISYRELFAFGIPSSIAIFCLSSLISTDIIVVKNLFNPEQAGLYAGMSLVGRIIFFLTAPIVTVMFPTIIQKYNKKEDYRGVMMLAIGLVLVISSSITVFYYFFPRFTISFILKNASYLAIADSLWLFGIFISLYSLISLLTYYFLSTNKTNVYFFLLIASILQVVLIYITHSTIARVVHVSIAVSSLLLLTLLLYYLVSKKRKNTG